MPPSRKHDSKDPATGRRESKAHGSDSEVRQAADGRIPVLVVVGSMQGDAHARGVLRVGDGLDIRRGRAALAPGAWTIDDELVSRRHACIERTAAGFAVTDLDSKNGTF